LNGEDLLVPRSSQKLKDYPLSAVHHSLFRTSIPGDRLLYQQSDDAPCLGYRDPIARENVGKLIIPVITKLLHKTSFEETTEEKIQQWESRKFEYPM
jgi:hypothetical protein